MPDDEHSVKPSRRVPVVKAPREIADRGAGWLHAALLESRAHQRQGIATALVGHAVRHAEAAGCEWLHVDFGEHLAAFYPDACGFQSTPAGVIHLPTHGHDRAHAD